MLLTLRDLPHSELPRFLMTLNPLCSSNPTLFEPYLSDLLKFLPGLILPPSDAGPTPTVTRPFPKTGGSFKFPPDPHGHEDGDAEDEGKEERDEIRQSALEFMLTLSEARPAMVKRTPGWTMGALRGCLEGMAELRDDDYYAWLDADVRCSLFYL